MMAGTAAARVKQPQPQPLACRRWHGLPALACAMKINDLRITPISAKYSQ
jgi:hypothetical protein